CSRVRTQVFLFPDIPKFPAARKADLRQLDGNIAGTCAAVEKADRNSPAAQRPRPNLQIAILVQAVALFSQRILVDGNRLLVGEDPAVRLTHLAQIVAGKQWRGKDGPQAHVGTVFILAHLAVTDLQHVRIIPMTGTGKSGEPRLAETDFAHSGIGVGDVT